MYGCMHTFTYASMRACLFVCLSVSLAKHLHTYTHICFETLYSSICLLNIYAIVCKTCPSICLSSCSRPYVSRLSINSLIHVCLNISAGKSLVYRSTCVRACVSVVFMNAAYLCFCTPRLSVYQSVCPSVCMYTRMNTHTHVSLSVSSSVLLSIFYT